MCVRYIRGSTRKDAWDRSFSVRVRRFRTCAMLRRLAGGLVLPSCNNLGHRSALSVAEQGQKPEKPENAGGFRGPGMSTGQENQTALQRFAQLFLVA